jgi:multicomponent Na+:H+ antiporter subunit E
MRTVQPGRANAAGPQRRWRAVLLRILLFVALWWVLTEGVVYGWVLSLATIALAVAASLALVPPNSWRWRAGGLLRFVPFFLSASIRGGIDVGVRAFHPRLPIHPGTLHFPLRLPPGPARTFFAATLSLLPGTLSVELRGDTVLIHTLDSRMQVVEPLRELEARVAALFGAPIDEAAEAPGVAGLPGP